jgi:hypothetical protein
MISFAAHHRKAVRLERRDRIRREVREGVEMLARCEAGDPEALRQSEENYRALVAASEAWSEADYPEPDEIETGLEPDEGPRHALRPGESERQYRRRMGRPDLAERRAARLLARGYWRADRPLPGAIREALCALSMAPRELRRMLFGIWERGGLARRGDRWRRIRGPRELAHFWAVDPRELLIGWPGDDGRGLEVCPLRGPPAGAAAVGITLPDCTGGAVVVS